MVCFSFVSTSFYPSATAAAVAPTDQSPVDPTSIAAMNVLQGALNMSTGQQAQMMQALVNQASAYTPASEPAFVTMAQMLGGSGNVPPFYTSVSFSGRGSIVITTADTGNVPDGYQASSPGAISPLILDLSGSGIPDVAGQQVNPHPYTFSHTRTTLFDMNADGYVDFTEWVGPRAALLVSPATPEKVQREDGQLLWNGSISAADLIGTYGGYRDGFEHLSSFDTNGDGTIDGDELNRLYMWIDKNGNGKVDRGELYTPQALGIEALNLQHTGYTGSYVRSGYISTMWDWWPTFLQVIPSPTFNTQSPGCTDATVTLHGNDVSTATPDFRVTISSSNNRNITSIPMAALEHAGFNTFDSLLARVSPSGQTVVLVDYRAQKPHTARLWLLTKDAGSSWLLTRFSLPEDSIDQVSFDETGNRLLLLTHNQTQLYVIDQLTEGGSDLQSAFHPTLSRVVWNDHGRGFRVLWGTTLSQGKSFYVPGYFHAKDGARLCDSLAQLQISGEHVTLQPSADIHWLDGDELARRGFSRPFMFMPVSPTLSYVAVKSATGGVTLLAIQGRQASGGHISQLDSMHAIGGLSANSTRVEYLAQEKSGVWDMRWSDFSHNRHVVLPLANGPSYPELAGDGKQSMWAVFDWTHGTTSLWGLDASSSNARAQKVINLSSITGPIRVASNASLMAVQTSTNIIVWSTTQ